MRDKPAKIARPPEQRVGWGGELYLLNILYISFNAFRLNKIGFSLTFDLFSRGYRVQNKAKDGNIKKDIYIYIKKKISPDV